MSRSVPAILEVFVLNIDTEMKNKQVVYYILIDYMILFKKRMTFIPC